MAGKWVVFGASGFIGQALTKRLADSGVDFTAHSSRTLDLLASDAPTRIADAVRDGDIIVMLSASTPEKGTAETLLLNNLLMMQHLLAGIAQWDIGRFIYASSDAVYPLTADIVDERTQPCPYDLYGCMHLAREQWLKLRIAPETLTILRPCAVYGMLDTHNSYGINRFIRSAMAQGEIALFGGGEEYRDHVHVDDVAEIILAAGRQRISGMFNIASGTSWRFSQIAALIRSGLAKKEIALLHKPRTMPIFHRHFDTSLLCSRFPSQRPRPVDAGIRQWLNKESS